MAGVRHFYGTNFWNFHNFYQKKALFLVKWWRIIILIIKALCIHRHRLISKLSIHHPSSQAHSHGPHTHHQIIPISYIYHIFIAHHRMFNSSHPYYVCTGMFISRNSQNLVIPLIRGHILSWHLSIVFFRCQILLIHYLYSPSCGNLQHMVPKFSSQLYTPGHSLHHIVKTIYVSKSPTRQYS